MAVAKDQLRAPSGSRDSEEKELRKVDGRGKKNPRHLWGGAEERMKGEQAATKKLWSELIPLQRGSIAKRERKGQRALLLWSRYTLKGRSGESHESRAILSEKTGGGLQY